MPDTLLDYTPEGCKTNSSLRVKTVKIPKIKKINAIYLDEALEIQNNACLITRKDYSLKFSQGEEINFNNAWRLFQNGELPKSQVFKLCAGSAVRKPKSYPCSQLDLHGDNTRKPIMDYDFIKFCADGYINETENKRILLKHIENNNLRFIPYTHMLTKRYTRRLLAKFGKLKHEGLGVTLTLRNSPDNSVYYDRCRATKHFDTLMNRIRRHCAKHGFDVGAYFGVVEIGDPPRLLDNGYITIGFNVHIHVIFYNLPWVEHKWLQNAWHEITGDSLNVFVSKRSQKAKKYIIKYLSKGLRGDLSPTMVLNWACGKRMWISSNHLFEEKKEIIIIPESMWEIVGLVDCSYIGVFEVIEEKPPPLEVESVA